MEAIIIALIEHVGLPLVLRIIAASTPREKAEAALAAAYELAKETADAAANAIIDTP